MRGILRLVVITLFSLVMLVVTAELSDSVLSHCSPPPLPPHC